MAKYVLGFLKQPEFHVQSISIEDVEAASIEDVVANSKVINGDNPTFTSKDLKIIWELKYGESSTEVSEKICQYFNSFWG